MTKFNEKVQNINMKKFKIGDFVYDAPLEETYQNGFTALKIIGFNEVANKYYCLVYDEVSFEPYAINLIEEKRLEFIKGSKFEKYYPKRYLENEQSKPIPVEILYAYPIYDVDGLNYKLIREVIYKVI